MDGYSVDDRSSLGSAMRYPARAVPVLAPWFEMCSKTITIIIIAYIGFITSTESVIDW